MGSSAKAPGARRYLAHCLFCGHDASTDRPDPAHCPRCKGDLFLEVDLEPRAAAVRVERLVVAGRRRDPRRHRYRMR